MNSQLGVTYTQISAPVDGYWLRITQDQFVSDAATVSDASALLDSLFSIDPCTDEASGSEEDISLVSLTDPESMIAYIQSAAEDAGIETVICDQDSDGSVDVQLKVITSHPFDPHRLSISGGTLESEVVINAVIDADVVVDGASSVVLDFPVVSGFTAEWTHTAGESPAINRTGNTLYWKGNVRGILHVSYQTTYHLATIKVDGIDGSQGEATVRCFFHGLVDEVVPDLPEPAEYDTSLCGEGRIIWETEDDNDDVTCYQNVAVSKKCSCSKEEIDRYTYDQVVTCPENAPKKCPGAMSSCMHFLGTVAATEYVKCTNDEDGQYSDPDFYELVCCHPPTVPLPDCEEEKRSWKGGAQLEHGIDYWRDLYGQDLRIVQVLPKGLICGEWTIRQSFSGACCDNADPLVWDEDRNATSIAQNDSTTLYVLGGLGPYTWNVSGIGVEFENGQTTIVTQNRSVVLNTNASNCGTIDITVTDWCSQETSGYILSTAGSWQPTGESCGFYRSDQPNSYVYDGKYRYFVNFATVCSDCYAECIGAPNKDCCYTYPHCGEWYSQDCDSASGESCHGCLLLYRRKEAWAC